MRGLTGRLRFTPWPLYLAAAGIGTLGLVDFDVVDSSNLQRQIIHSTKDIGRLKLDSAEEKLKALNPFMKIVKFNTMLLSANAMEIFKDFDIVADGTDNFPTRLPGKRRLRIEWKAKCLRGRFSALKARPASLLPEQGSVIATGASILSRRRRVWFHLVPRVGCSESCPD